MKRLVLLAHRVPYPPDKGERLRAFHEIRALSEHFHITVAALAHNRADRNAAAGLAEFCDEVIIASVSRPVGLLGGGVSFGRGRSVTEGYFASRRLSRLVAAAAGDEPFDVALGYCSAMLPALLAAPAGARVLDLVDVDSAKWAAYAEASGGLKRWLYRTESRRVARLERLAIQRCDAVALVSAAEAEALGSAGGNVLAIGNGVDLDYFAPTPPPAVGPGFSAVFTGTMDYRPNADGVCWFVREVWPRIRVESPDATFTIVGRNPTAAVRQLADSPGVTVTGSVPDVRPYLTRATVAVAPLQVARGVQNKVLEAMAAARPVVATGAALEGLDVKVGREVLRADTPDQWVECLSGLFGDPSRARELGRTARSAVEDRYRWSAQMQPLVDLCLRLGS